MAEHKSDTKKACGEMSCWLLSPSLPVRTTLFMARLMIARVFCNETARPGPFTPLLRLYRRHHDHEALWLFRFLTLGARLLAFTSPALAANASFYCYRFIGL